MIRVLIADDEAPARQKLSHWLAGCEDVELVAEASDGLAAAQQIAQHHPDLVLLDISMPGLTGLEIAAQLDPATAPLLVFVTAFDEYAVKAFELAAIDYLLKPCDQQRFMQMLERVRARLALGTDASDIVATCQQLQLARAPLQHLLVPARECMQVIAVDTIQWLESDDNLVHLHLTGQSCTLRRPLQQLLKQLDASRFVRIHKSTAVNISAIATVEPLFKGDYEITLRNGQSLRLSRRYKDAAFALLGAMLPG